MQCVSREEVDEMCALRDLLFDPEQLLEKSVGIPPSSSSLRPESLIGVCNVDSRSRSLSRIDNLKKKCPSSAAAEGQCSAMLGLINMGRQGDIVSGYPGYSCYQHVDSCPA